MPFHSFKLNLRSVLLQILHFANERFLSRPRLIRNTWQYIQSLVCFSICITEQLDQICHLFCDLFCSDNEAGHPFMGSFSLILEMDDWSAYL